MIFESSARPTVAALVLLTAITTSLTAFASAPPNIVFVIGDDHGWPYYGFQESPQILSNGQNVQEVVQTPNLDALAASGVLFSRGYATGSVCAPSLQTLLSAHGHEWSQWDRLRDQVDARTAMPTLDRLQRRENQYADNLPRTLGRHGYRTWEGGKLWAGLASDAGFDDGLATFVDEAPLFLSGGSTFGREGWNVADCGSTASTSNPCPALDPLRGFLDDVGDAPFFAWFAPALPHVPWDAPQEYRTPLETAGLQPYEVDHLSNVRWFDEVLGELLLELERRDLRDDTLIVYASDNGWGLGFQFFAGKGRGKGTVYDLGFRTPIIFNQPGGVPAGAVYADFVSFSDLPATILDYAGAPIPAHSMGVSLRDRIEGGSPIGRQGLAMFDGDGGAWVDDQWRYDQFDDGHEELYRIDLDPFEQNDLAAQQPDLVAQYRARVNARRTELATFPGVVEIAGRIEDAAGEPIPGGKLRLRGGPSTIDALTGPAGWFRFASVDVSSALRLQRSRGLRAPLLDAVSGGPIPAPFSLPGLFQPIVATAARPVEGPLGASISGRVLTSEGAPVGAAQIRVLARLPATDLALTTISQPDGTYVLENLAVAPDYHLRVSARGYGRSRLDGIGIFSPSDRLEIDVVFESR